MSSMFPPIRLAVAVEPSRKRYIDTNAPCPPDPPWLRLRAIARVREVPDEQRGQAYWDETLRQWLFLRRREDAVELELWSQASAREVTLSRRTVEPLGLYDHDSDAWERYVVEERARRAQHSA